MNLVVGATGLVGMEVCRLLREAGKPVRALVRLTSDTAKIEKLTRWNVERVVGDLKDRASLDAACAGATAVISTASATISRQQGDSLDSVDLAGQLALVDAAKAAGVRRFVYISFRTRPEIEFPLQSAKMAVEKRLAESGMGWTVLQPSLFMEVWLSPRHGFDYPNGRVRVLGSGKNPISWVSYRDVAAIAAAAVDNPAAANACIPVGGPDALSPLDVARIYEELTGRKIETDHVPEEALRQGAQFAADPMEKSFAALGLFAAMGDTIDMKPVLAQFPGIRLTSVREFAKQATSS